MRVRPKETDETSVLPGGGHLHRAKRRSESRWYNPDCSAPVAQWIEQRPSKPLAESSNLSGRARSTPDEVAPFSASFSRSIKGRPDPPRWSLTPTAG